MTTPAPQLPATRMTPEHVEIMREVACEAEAEREQASGVAFKYWDSREDRINAVLANLRAQVSGSHILVSVEREKDLSEAVDDVLFEFSRTMLDRVAMTQALSKLRFARSRWLSSSTSTSTTEKEK
jgi:hypothetical protein